MARFETADIERHKKKLFSYAMKLTKNNFHDAEDLVQTVILEYLKKLSSGVEVENPNAYLHGILKNTFIKQLKQKKLIDEVINHLINYSDEMYDPDIQNSDNQSREEILSKLILVIEILPDYLRIPIVRYYFENRKIKDIAFEMKVSIRTIKYRINEGKKIIKKEMQKMM